MRTNGFACPARDVRSLAALGVHIHGVGTASAARAAELVTPRYHVSATEGVFWQRLPYRNGSKPPTMKKAYITRFVGLGAISGAWLVDS